MEDFRRHYPLIIGLNGRRFKRVLIDPHYEENHPDMTDEVILELVRLLNGTDVDLNREKGEFRYFVETLSWQRKKYRLIFGYCQDDYIGVINAFRVEEKKS